MIGRSGKGNVISEIEDRGKGRERMQGSKDILWASSYVRWMKMNQKVRDGCYRVIEGKTRRERKRAKEDIRIGSKGWKRRNGGNDYRNEGR